MALPSSAKPRPSREALMRLVQPLAHRCVRALARTRVEPHHVVLAHSAVGLAGAWLLAGEGAGRLLAAAALLQVKTLLDNVDGGLARATGRVTLLGRYLDTLMDLLVNVALFAALTRHGPSWAAWTALVTLTLVLSTEYNAMRRHLEEHGEAPDAAPPPGRAAGRDRPAGGRLPRRARAAGPPAPGARRAPLRARGGRAVGGGRQRHAAALGRPLLGRRAREPGPEHAAARPRPVRRAGEAVRFRRVGPAAAPVRDVRPALARVALPPRRGRRMSPAAAPPAAGRPVALVTGSAVGIGRAVLLALAADGYDVAVHYRSSAAEAEAVAAEARALGATPALLRADVTVEREAAGLVEAAHARFGRLDVLVNNVGEYHNGPLAELGSDVWHQIIASNLHSTFYICQRALPFL